MEKLPVPRVGTVESHLTRKGIPSFLGFCAIYRERADILQKPKGEAETSLVPAHPLHRGGRAGPAPGRRRAPAQIWDY